MSIVSTEPELVKHYDRSSFAASLCPDELPKDNTTLLHHVFGYTTEKKDNLEYIEPGVVLYIAGNLLVTMDIRTVPPTRSYVFGVDGRGVGSFVVHPRLPLVAVGEKGNDPNVYIYQYPTWELVHVLQKGAERSFSCMQFSTDGSMLATVAGSPDFIITIWDWRQERITLHTKAFGQEVFKVSFSPFDEGRLVTCGTGHIRFWKMARTFTGLKLQGDIGKFGKIELSDVDDFAILPDGKVLSTSETGYLLMWDGNFVKYRVSRPGGIPCHDGIISHVSLIRSKSGEGIAFMSAGADGKLCWWDFEALDGAEIDMDKTTDFEMEPLKEYWLGEDVSVRTVLRSSRNSATNDPHMLIIDSNGRLIKLHIEEVFSRRGSMSAEEAQHVTAGSESKESDAVRGYTFDVIVADNLNATKSCFETLFECHAGGISAMDVSSVDHFCATGGKDGTIRCFDYVTKSEVFRDSWSEAVTSLVWAPVTVSVEGRAVFAGFRDGVVRVLWRGNAHQGENVSKWTREQVFKPHNGAVSGMAFSNDGSLFATIGTDGIAFIFKAESLPRKGATRCYDPVGFISLAVTPDVINDSSTSVFRRQEPLAASSVTFRPDGLAMILSCSDGRIAEVSLTGLEAAAAEKSESFELSLSTSWFSVLRPKLVKGANVGERSGDMTQEEGGNRSSQYTETVEDDLGVETKEEIEQECMQRSPREEDEDTRPLPPALSAVYFKSRMNKLLVSYGDDLGGRLWEVGMKDGTAEPDEKYLIGTGPRASQKDMPAPPIVRVLRYSSSKQFILTGANDGSVTLRQAGTDLVPLEYSYLRLMAHDGDDGAVTSVALSFDNNFLLSAGEDGLLLVFRLQHEFIEEAAKAGVVEHRKRTIAEASQITYTPPIYTPNPATLCVGVAPGAVEVRENAKKQQSISEADQNDDLVQLSKQPFELREILSTAITEKEAPPDMPHVEEVDDITDVAAYSIEDAKLKTEEDNRRAEAEAKKTLMRDRVKELQRDFTVFATDNSALRADLSSAMLDDEEMLVDPEYAQVLNDEGAQLIAEFQLECAYGSEKAAKTLDKLKYRFLSPLETEPTVLSAFLSRQRIKSFPNQRIQGLLNDVLERVRANIRSEQLSAARSAGFNAEQSFCSNKESQRNDGDVNVMLVDASRKGGEKKLNSQDDAPSGKFSVAEPKNKIVSDEDEKKKTFETRKEARLLRHLALDEMVETKPGINDDDPKDLDSIKYAENNMGDYRLKASKEYEVSEDKHINTDKKLRQIVLLEENMVEVKRRFNCRVLELRGLKRQIAVSVTQGNLRVKEIDYEMSEGIKSTSDVSFSPIDMHFTPALEPCEWRSDRHLHTNDELKAFQSSGVAAPLSLIPGLESGLERVAYAQTEAETVMLGTGTGTFGTQRTAPLINAASFMDPMVTNKALASIPVLSYLGSDNSCDWREVGLGASIDDDDTHLTSLQQENAWIRCVTLRAERSALRQKNQEHIEAFDEALHELSKERLVLSADLKAAEIRLLVLLQEYEMLQDFEYRDTAMATRLDKCQREKGEVVANVTEVQSRLKAKREELARCKEQEKELHEEFIALVPPGHAYHQQLSKIFKRKIKRSKKRDEEDEDAFDDDEEDVESNDDDEYDEDEEEDDAEEADDSCPPGCDTQLHENVLEQRAKRLDQEDKLSDLQKIIDELDRSLTRYEARQKQINKDLYATKNEIRRFQTEKQQKLNQLYAPVPMQLNQLCNLLEAEEDTEFVKTTISNADKSKNQITAMKKIGADALLSGNIVPQSLNIDAGFSTHSFFPAGGLGKLRKRIDDIKDENNSERSNFKELHKTKSKLERARAINETNIKMLEEKNKGLQMLRFGQLVNMELLDQGNDGAGKEEEMNVRIAEQEMKNESELFSMELKSKGLKESLLRATQQNTELLNEIAELSGRQFHLEKELNGNSSGVSVNDTGPTVRSEVEERNRLVGLVKLQSKEIDALKAEINLLRRKTGHVYVSGKT